MNHQAERTPSLFSTQSPGTGPTDSSISSDGIGLYTLSLLERSRAMPTGIVLSILSLIGKVALFESSASSVVVKTLMIESGATSGDRGARDRVKRPISGDVVEDTMRTS